MKLNSLFLLAAFVASSVSLTANAQQSYKCKAIVGQSIYDPKATVKEITNFEVTNLGAIAGSVQIGSYRFSTYHWQNESRQMFLDIANVQSGSQVTPFLSLATAESVVPESGFEGAAVRLHGKAYLICEPK